MRSTYAQLITVMSLPFSNNREQLAQPFRRHERQIITNSFTVNSYDSGEVIIKLQSIFPRSMYLYHQIYTNAVTWLNSFHASLLLLPYPFHYHESSNDSALYLIEIEQAYNACSLRCHGKLTVNGTRQSSFLLQFCLFFTITWKVCL